SPPSAQTATQPPPTVSAAEAAAAKAQVCSTFQHADAAIGGTINAPDGAEPSAARANARAAVVSSALALTRAIGPVTPSDVATHALRVGVRHRLARGSAVSTFPPACGTHV